MKFVLGRAHCRELCRLILLHLCCILRRGVAGIELRPELADAVLSRVQLSGQVGRLRGQMSSSDRRSAPMSCTQAAVILPHFEF